MMKGRKDMEGRKFMEGRKDMEGRKFMEGRKEGRVWKEGRKEGRKDLVLLLVADWPKKSGSTVAARYGDNMSMPFSNFGRKEGKKGREGRELKGGRTF